MALTEAGRGFVAAVGPALGEVEEAVERVRAAKGEVTGLLRINAPRLAQPTILTPVIAEMSRRYPDLTLEVTSDDGLVDIVAGGFDAGIRLGEMIAQDMVAVRLTPPLRAIMVAAPDYLDRRGTPAAIADLQNHNCIGYRMVAAGAVYDWELQEGGVDLAVSVNGTTRVTDTLYALDLALAGVGIAYMFEAVARGDLAAGRLRQVLPRTAIEEPGLFLYFPRRAAEAPKLRAFIDTAREVLKPRVPT